jgi:hypothetical protein
MKKLIVILVSIYSVFTTNLMAQVPNYVPTNGLVAWYPFTGNANDESGNGNNGTVNGATLTTDRFGNANKAYSFNGTSNFISVSNNNSLQTPNAISVNSWVQFSGPGQGSSRLISKGWSPNGIEVHTETSTNHKIRCGGAFNGTGYGPISQTTLADSQWYMVTTIDNGNVKYIYINGTLEGTLVHNYGSVPVSTINLCFGKNSQNATDYLDGKLDDIGIWNRVLTQQEITALYNACLNNITNITPQNNQVNIGNTATFTANTSATSPSYIWQSDLGQGFQTLNSVGKYSGTSTNNLSISNVQLTNHFDPIRAIITYGSCKDTSNIAYIKITDTCITKVTKYDTITTKITKYDTIKVMDTLVINANLSGISAPNNTNRIIVYPNPAKDHITIDYGVFSRMSGYTVKITNTLGQTVFTSPINQQTSYINLSTWTGKGLYYLQIIDPNSNMIENRKIVLQ